MEPDRIDYSPIITRPKLMWPGTKRVALWVVPNVEYYEYLPQVRVRNPWPRMPHPDVLNYGVRDYGNRVGLWRMIEVLDHHKLPITVSLNLANYEHFPEILRAQEARNWEILCHGLYNTQYVWNMPIEEERALIAECVATHRRLTGRDLPGWFSPAASNTVNTADLVAEAGITYYSDWYQDQDGNTRVGPLYDGHQRFLSHAHADRRRGIRADGDRPIRSTCAGRGGRLGPRDVRGLASLHHGPAAPHPASRPAVETYAGVRQRLAGDGPTDRAALYRQPPRRGRGASCQGSAEPRAACAAEGKTVMNGCPQNTHGCHPGIYCRDPFPSAFERSRYAERWAPGTSPGVTSGGCCSGEHLPFLADGACL
jgi:Polysaccharide deacetylase